MFQVNHDTDPIVEILRLAYRRGLAIRREQGGQNQLARPENSSKGDVTKQAYSPLQVNAQNENLLTAHRVMDSEDINNG